MGFGIIGIIAFVIDLGLMNVFMKCFSWYNIPAATLSFVISLMFNYLASMKFVFRHRQDMARWMEILIFVLSSVVGLLINSGIIWLSTVGMNDAQIAANPDKYQLLSNAGKIVATVIVAVWNFVIRKWLLDASVDDDHDPSGLQSGSAEQSGAGVQAASGEQEERNTTFARRLGLWSLQHTPKGWPQ